jgi:CDP-glycerol glycerophosphotransferase (TagB/SpsB family)
MEIRKVRKSHKSIVKRLKGKSKLNLVFLVIHNSVWKYEELYRLLEDDSRISVHIAVIPLIKQGRADMTLYYKTLKHFELNNYKTLVVYDEEHDTWLDIKKILNPDVVFFTNSHNITLKQYFIYHFTDLLTCYVPYAFVVIKTLEIHYNKFFHKLLWRYFVETEYHKTFSKKYNKSTNQNVIVTGFPGLDTLFNKNYQANNPWKVFNSAHAKKIIWAPHHTIEKQGGEINYSNFKQYADFFIDLLHKRQDIQIAFKPHPTLKRKLYNDPHWGKDRTDDYYDMWKILPNGQLEDGPYLDLFLHSDAMITDSASFIAEYMYFNKPQLFTLRDDFVINRFNSFGRMVLNHWYKAKNPKEIIRFIEDRVLRENDVMTSARNKFFMEVILPKNGQTASENIYSELKTQLW